MGACALTPDDLRHAALVDELAAAIEGRLAKHDFLVHGAVLATLFGKFLLDCPPALRAGIVAEHVKLAQGLVELLELQANDRQAN